VFSNARRFLSQRNGQLRVVYLLSRCIVELDVYSVIHFTGQQYRIKKSCSN